MGQLIVHILNFRVTVNIPIYRMCTFENPFVLFSLVKSKYRINLQDNKTMSQETRCLVQVITTETWGEKSRAPLLMATVYLSRYRVALLCLTAKLRTPVLLLENQQAKV